MRNVINIILNKPKKKKNVKIMFMLEHLRNIKTKNI